MPSNNLVTIATAGSGKTTGLVREALAAADEKSALLTYTRNGAGELRTKALLERGVVPEHVHVSTWFTFLLKHFVRPYQRTLHETPVRKLAFVEGRSARYVAKTDVARYYFGDPDSIFSDKIAQFGCELIKQTDGRPLRRLEQIYQRLHIDEVQDLAGYDLDLLEHIFATNIQVRMVGDIRQATYKTNNSGRHSQFGGARILSKFEAWQKAEHLAIDYNTSSHRCVQAICDLADLLYPDLPKATSLNTDETGHDGVFAVRQSDVPAYMETYQPQPLRLDRRTRNVPGCPINFGAAKGCTFERVIIFPHGKLRDAIKHGDFARLGDAPSTIAKVYVAITRARQSVAFVIPDNLEPKLVPLYEL